MFDLDVSQISARLLVATDKIQQRLQADAAHDRKSEWGPNLNKVHV